MPGYRAHLACALLIYIGGIVLLLQCVQSVYLFLGGLGAICAGALFPDIDVKSKGQQYLYTVYACLLGSVIFLSFMCPRQLWTDFIVCLAIVSIIPLLGRHRGITHKPIFIILLGVVFWIVGIGLCPRFSEAVSFYSGCFVLGALSHIWLDYRRIFF